MPDEGKPATLQQARELMQCFGHHRSQPLEYALNYCLHCRKLKSCVRVSWGVERTQRWKQNDWWPADRAEMDEARVARSRARRASLGLG